MDPRLGVQVKDCTGVVQLMPRRYKRILLVLAASDHGDELVVLTSATADAQARTLGTVYNPVDPVTTTLTTRSVLKISSI